MGVLIYATMKNELHLSKESIHDKSYLDILRKHGVCVIESYIGAKDLSGLRKDFEKALDPKVKKGIQPADYSVGRACILHKEEYDHNLLPITSHVFFRNEFQEIADAYLGRKNNLNKEIFVVHDKVGSKHIANDLHFDVLNTFKFFIYLTDTTEENGAFTCVPGSHVRTSAIRKKLGAKVNHDNRELTRNLPYTDDEVIPIEGKAGTLILFDTDVFHKAGHVSRGERLVMRGHTRPIESHSLLHRIRKKVGV
jgi:ectoine hydroxylase-related dioxygenase (phytanoyl-CoA dioxygenase family)